MSRKRKTHTDSSPESADILVLARFDELPAKAQRRIILEAIMATKEELKDKPDALEADATAANEALSAALGRVL